MLKRWQKDLFYKISSPLMKMNSFKHKYINNNKSDLKKIHLGPGKKNYIEGWINIDANMFSGKCDMWLDLRFPLPFKESSINHCYSHHMIEHLPDIKKHLLDIFKILKPGGVYRIGGPNGDSAIKKFMENDNEWFNTNLDNRQSIGGKLESFIFCRQEHLTILTFSYLEELLSEIGFMKIKKLLPKIETSYPEVFGDCLKYERETDFNTPHTLIVECQKP